MELKSILVQYQAANPPKEVVAARKSIPSEKTVLGWIAQFKMRAIDGCPCNTYGNCEHGKPSWALRLGLS